MLCAQSRTAQLEKKKNRVTCVQLAEDFMKQGSVKAAGIPPVGLLLYS